MKFWMCYSLLCFYSYVIAIIVIHTFSYSIFVSRGTDVFDKIPRSAEYFICVLMNMLNQLVWSSPKRNISFVNIFRHMLNYIMPLIGYCNITFFPKIDSFFFKIFDHILVVGSWPWWTIRKWISICCKPDKIYFSLCLRQTLLQFHNHYCPCEICSCISLG